MDITQLLDSAKPDWTSRVPRPVAGLKLPLRVLGDEEAAVEFDNPQRAERTFVRMETYDDLKKPQALFLFGRRGTGKTTYLRMLDHEVRTKSVSHYATSCLLESQQLILGMSAHLRASPLSTLPEPELADALIPIWTWLITVAAMQCALKEIKPRASEPIEILRLRGYLNACVGESPSDESFQDHLNTRLHEMLERAIASDAKSGGSAISKIGTVFSDISFDQATAALAAILAKSPALVMLDAGDVYAIKDPIPNAVITALIAALTKFTMYKHGRAIFAKAAFPSEILPHMYSFNRGKMQNHIVIISWTYRDLVTLLAKRFAMANGKNGDDLKKLNDLDLAHKLIYTHLPDVIQTRVGINFDTLAYVIRHTQRTPRQVVLLVNSILTHAETTGWTMGQRIEETDVIVQGVHLYIGHLVNDSIDMHRSIYERLDEIVQRALSMRPCYFKAVELGKFVKDASEVRHSANLDRGDAIRILFEIGALGVAHQLHQLSKQDKPSFILEAMFEYQIKQALTPSKETYCVVHPMFYEWLSTRVDATKFVYPVAFEAEERSVLTQYGFIGPV